MVDATGNSDVEKLRREAEELRALVRMLSARLTALVASLPPEMAVALARGESEGESGPFRLTGWHETIEMTRADVASELDLLWKRVPPRESA